MNKAQEAILRRIVRMTEDIHPESMAAMSDGDLEAALMTCRIIDEEALNEVKFCKTPPIATTLKAARRSLRIVMDALACECKRRSYAAAERARSEAAMAHLEAVEHAHQLKMIRINAVGAVNDTRDKAFRQVVKEKVGLETYIEWCNEADRTLGDSK